MEKQEFHFYAASVYEWRTGEDIESVIKFMKTGKVSFELWYVPLPADAEYKISMYGPQVPGSISLGLLGKKSKK